MVIIDYALFLILTINLFLKHKYCMMMTDTSFLVDPTLTPIDMVRQAIAARVKPGIVDDDFIFKIFQSLEVTQAQIEEIAAAAQRSEAWEIARKGCINHENQYFQPPRLSSSTVGDVLDHNYPDYETKALSSLRMLQKSIWPELEKPADPQSQLNFDKGTALEPWFMSLLEVVLQNLAMIDDEDNELITIEHGFRIHERYFWLGVSIDIVIWTINRRTGKISCRGGEMKARANSNDLPYPHIKHSYYDQIQSTMFVLNREFKIQDYVFACYSPNQFSFEMYDYDEHYWHKQMERLKVFYYAELIPRFILKCKHKLSPGMLDPPLSDIDWSDEDDDVGNIDQKNISQTRHYFDNDDYDDHDNDQEKDYNVQNGVNLNPSVELINRQALNRPILNNDPIVDDYNDHPFVSKKRIAPDNPLLDHHEGVRRHHPHLV